ncbi:ABC transporter ATP-binding protein [Clostridium beijerinckii]|jgi:ABC-type multidrug transport system, ATPase and permease components|uniref:ABC transporter ATP-binding protein n=2 Tax=Clostridium beijerinckii TaxID=1520 RepID=A0AAE2RQP7_CLOBE|nr:ABC transporter ATP-binding protein [Clostridium beijerinckii]ABR35427.1 ABC transporter related [Clostridium beijerinckii NCIMB 8052]AIU01678.1 ABC transporter related protein [Clostridium beijerinckii ATCC 35702]MBF7809930.1 ABC transporter ATP-binding protein [Clostridium beijerinckii]NRT69274.1 ATP-binding cassette subfamily B protein [Clostridium beijerinckii]NRT84577.1 ATP-binding cassette subfamily B protein [Clostridium beijerinckii]
MIKRLAGFVAEFKRDSILTPLYVALEVVMETIIPLLMAWIIDNGVGKGNVKYVSIVGGAMIITSFLSLTFGVLGGVHAAKASSGFARNLRKGMYYNIQNFSFSNIDKYSTAGLVTRLTTDVTNVQNAFQMIIRMAVRAPFMLISATTMCFYINAKLSMIFIGAIVFLGVILYFIMTTVHPYFVEVFKKYDDLNASVQENLTGIRAVKAYVREEHETSKFYKASKTLYKYFIRAEKLIIVNAPAMQFTVYTCILLLSWLGAKMIVSNTMSTGELMSLFTYTLNILMSLMFLSMVFVMVIMSKSSAERITEVLNEKSDLANDENPVYEVKDGSITFNNVGFSYNKNKDNLVLENINLKINSGETIGIIGGTGSSKTTLVQLIPRLYDATNGSVEVGGVDVRKYDIETLRDEVSMVLQKNVLFSGTIKENLRWGNKDASDEELIDACKQAQADEFIESLPNKYDTFIEQGGTNVSGGQKQRLCIARALLKKPKILILDDSTSAVDTKTDALIRKAFKETIPNTTKIIIAQRISSVQDADKIVVLNDGKIDGFGTHEELLKSNEIYSEVYESQMKGASDNE